jgi:MFS family permease
VSYAVLGAIVGLANFAGGLLQLGFGIIGRMYPRNLLLGLGNVLWGVSTALTALTTSFAPFAALRFVAATANAPQHPVGLGMISDRYPRERRGVALAVNYAGGNLGTLLVPLIAVALISQFGWQGTLWLFALPGVIVGIVLMVALPDLNRNVAGAAPVPTVQRLGRLFANHNVRALLGASGVAAAGQGLGPLLIFVPLYLTNGLGLSAAGVGVLYTTLLLGGAVGPLISGRLSDRLGRRPILIFNLVLSALCMTLVIVVGGPALPLLGIGLFLLGMFAFTESSLIQVFLADSVAATDRELVFGLYFAWVFTIGAPWTALIGAIVDRAGFAPAFALMAAAYLGAAALVIPSREPAETPA